MVLPTGSPQRQQNTECNIFTSSKHVPSQYEFAWKYLGCTTHHTAVGYCRNFKTHIRDG